MSEIISEALLDALLAEFGDNAGFALDLHAQYRLDPSSVGKGWRRAFERLEGNLASSAKAASPRASVSTRAGEESRPLTGGAATVARNMEASLAVPTATSNRLIAVTTLEENRGVINRHREVLGLSKISFTHLTAWAIVRALARHPEMNDAFGEQEGRPVRIRKPGVNLGVAVDVLRKDGTHTLLVPNIKSAETLDFARFASSFDEIVSRARGGTIEPDAFFGTTISLTNPGTVGTFSSSPRLMPGQGTIIATGAMSFPPGFAAMSPEVLARLGVARVMNVSSTYDHRIIQGGESGRFLATLEELLLGGDGFYERIFSDLKVPHRPVAWQKDANPPLLPGGSEGLEAVRKQAQILPLINIYRVRGHLVADLEPLGYDAPRYHTELDPATYGFTLWDLDRVFITNGMGGVEEAPLREILEILRQTYCGKVGAEFMFIQDPVQKRWLMDRMESTRNRASLSAPEKLRILEQLVDAEAFERFLHTKYVGHKRFSLEGAEAAIPLLARVLDRAVEAHMEEAVIGMSHRGRLTVLATVVGKAIGKIFAEFEDVTDVDSIQGSGDVKYHLGAVGRHRAPDGREITVALAPNPSHLEFVDPVVEGMVRAKQDRMGDAGRERVLPILLHGDAAFSGQGIVAETFNMSQLEGFRTGGTVHVVVNNQIGFTTNPADARSSPYATDVAKMVQAPVFHVNGDDPEAVVHAVDVALSYRATFRRDVVIDLVCYRRYGHNEGDEPSYTQPLLYQKIKKHPSVARRYGAELVRERVVNEKALEALWQGTRDRLQQAHDAGMQDRARPAFDSLAVLPAPPLHPGGSVRERLETVIRAVSSVPEGFEVHPKLRSLLARRAAYPSSGVDWAGAELLAFGMLLISGTPVRLSGQDSGRGTFSQRHSVLADVGTGRELVPLNAIAERQARFEVVDSLLSENAVMGFEFGYSVADPSTLVLWEGQFGDFANGAQVIIDQFISGSEQKWNQRCGLVLLLPHGQEGQGPEHSSARLERFLALCAEENLRVVNPSTPAQYYHLLVRQAVLEPKRPLVVMTPKSLLRHPGAVSPIAELADGAFHEVLTDAAFATRSGDAVDRVLLASGKIVYDLIAAREKARLGNVAIVRMEQLYPFPGAELGRLLGKFPAGAELVYVQEEPRNMGAWNWLRGEFLEGHVVGVNPGRPVRYVGRRELASPAPGSHRVFQIEQDAIVEEALRVGPH